MKYKYFFVFAFLLLFYPSFSQAIMMPWIYFDLNVNSEGGDGLFPFVIKDYLPQYDEDGNFLGYAWQEYDRFELQTENSASYNSYKLYLSQKYMIEQDSIDGWKVENIHCASDNAENSFFYEPNRVIISNIQIYSHVTCIFDNVIADSKPVLIVPGLLGTELKKGDESLWVDLDKIFSELKDNFLDPLRFTETLQPIDQSISASGVIKYENLFGAKVFNYLDGLVNEFEGQGYVEGETLFTFPYDWRYGVSGVMADGKTNVDLLKEKIDAILAQTGAGEVDVVAHSLGGLITKKYVMDHVSDNRINMAVFIGVPNTGSLKALKTLLRGDSFGIDFGPFGLDAAEIKKISQNMPAVYDLLPSQKYYDSNGSFINTITQVPSSLEHPLGQNISNDLNYVEFLDFVEQDHQFNRAGMDNSTALHNINFDNYDMRSAGVDVYAINGCKSPTISKILEYRQAYVEDPIALATYFIFNSATGDGTVPLSSADNLPADQDKIFYAQYADHGKMPSLDGIRQEVVNLVSGSNLATGNKIFTKQEAEQNPQKCQLSGTGIWMMSPVSINITDNLGNHSGPNADGNIENNIPGAGYEIMGDRKFIFLPEDEGQVYQINLKGQDRGVFTLKIEDIRSGTAERSEIFSNLPVTDNLLGAINLAGASTVLSLDNNGDGATDETLLPSAILEGQDALDILPPSSSAEILGSQGEPGFYRSDVVVKISAEDAGAGVLDIEYILDGGEVQKILGNLAELTVSAEGSHSIKYFSADKAGNNEFVKTISFVIDKTPPEFIVEFDPVAKDIKFSGKDGEQVTVVDKDNIITLSDKAGNSTEITLKSRNRKKLMTAEIKSLKYNGSAVDISKNRLSYVWNYDKNKNLTSLIQLVQSSRGRGVVATYNGRRTVFAGRDAKGLIAKSFNGLKIIKISADKGDFVWSY